MGFLTLEQRQRYGRYESEPTPRQLARYFHLDDMDKDSVKIRRGNHNRLGFALQLVSVRFLGTFLENPIDVPPGVITYIATQLNIVNYDFLPRYLERSVTHWEHQGEIKQRYGYRDFSAQPGNWQLTRWLYGRAWVGSEAPSVLFDLVTARLVEHKILLPGVTVLERLVASVRERTANRLWRILAKIPSAEQRLKLEALLVSDKKTWYTPLDTLRRSPTRHSAPALVNALNRLVEVRSFGINTLNFSKLPASRLKALARHAATIRVAAIARMPFERRIATLVAFIQVLEATAADDTLDVLELLIKDLLSKSVRDGKKERLRTIKDLDAAALRLGEACSVILDPNCEDKSVREVVFQRIPQEKLQSAVTKVEELARPPEDDYYPELLKRWAHVRRFLPSLLRTIDFQATKAGQSILKAVEFLKSIEKKANPKMDAAPLNGITKGWLQLIVQPNADIDRRAYTFCTLERLCEGLRHRELFITPSIRWSNPHAKLLQGSYWESARPQVCRALNLQPTPEPELSKLKQQLEEAFHRTANNLPSNAAVRVEPNKKGRDTLTVTNLDKLEEPASLKALKTLVASLLPCVDLPEALLEIHAKTGFMDEFNHGSQESSRVTDLPISVCAVLIATSCNIGLKPVIRADIPALTRNRLAWVQQNYLRSETLIRANARLVDAQTQIPLAQTWGGGEVASADGLRFVVPVQTLNSGPNSKYFGRGRGITYYNFTSDQFTGFHGLVVPGTLRDSLVVLVGLLEQQTSLSPRELMTDTSGYSDVIFGLFWLLGYQFSPRLADVGEARFWRLDSLADYGVLNGIARQKVNTSFIENYWDDMLRVAGSLKLGTVSASEIMRTLYRGDKPSVLGRAIGELGRIAKTLYLLNYVDDEAYRRRILTQLNRGEGRHGLARVIFHGQKGELRQRYREGQEDQLSALGLVVNALVLWNTYYMDAALTSIGLQQSINQEDIARLSPLGHSHVNMLGRYQFSLPLAVMQGEMRPLRDPNDPNEQED
ncbi:Tn3 family transposase [Calothrix sp. PCC 6303]|uniref:Tn3 family transposase n=1 Tax=Calothrix sp. PCC 6303 TaxID=1170562 RepID=UPI0002A00315|nr:Tn3 family transposase [Calothrix sp. PCC 6303]AFZ00606.1 transposase Tn3 family protein [Calothrix sp. PCC 6303]